MKTSKVLLSKDHGFTLVELMVVVAIIGILSAVAIPNFKRYQAKSKTSEAKLQLAALYSAETSFQADYDYFATCLANMGYNPGGAAGRYYAVGFNAENSAANTDASNNGASNCQDDATESFNFDAGKNVAGNTFTGVLPTGAVSGSGDQFTADAAGYISTDMASAGTYDVWNITENKVINHATIGY